MVTKRFDDATGVSGAGVEESLPEFDAFLEQIGYGHLYRRAEAEPVLDALQEPWSPPTLEEKTEVASREGRKGMVWALVMVVLVGTLLWTPALHVCTSLRDAWAMTAHPFLYQFDMTRPGTKVAEVCNKLGLPSVRRAIVGPLGQEEWIYVSPSARNASEDLMCILMVRSGRVMWKSKMPAPLH